MRVDGGPMMLMQGSRVMQSQAREVGEQASRLTASLERAYHTVSHSPEEWDWRCRQMGRDTESRESWRGSSPAEPCLALLVLSNLGKPAHGPARHRSNEKVLKHEYQHRLREQATMTAACSSKCGEVTHLFGQTHLCELMACWTQRSGVERPSPAR